jgi:hypothetical protein
MKLEHAGQRLPAPSPQVADPLVDEPGSGLGLRLARHAPYSIGGSTYRFMISSLRYYGDLPHAFLPDRRLPSLFRLTSQLEEKREWPLSSRLHT